MKSPQASSAVHIRPARLDDLETVVDFNASIARETEGKALQLDLLRRGVEAALTNPHHCAYFVAEVEGRIVGQTMLTYEWSDWRNGRFWWIQSVYVISEYRRQGIFRSLYRHIQSLARESRECCGLRLYVEEHNHVAQQTYKELGMNPTGYLVLEEDWTANVQRG